MKLVTPVTLTFGRLALPFGTSSQVLYVERHQRHKRHRNGDPIIIGDGGEVVRKRFEWGFERRGYTRGCRRTPPTAPE